MSIQQYRVGIIGTGRIASTLEDEQEDIHPCTHAGAYHAYPKTKIVAVSGRNRERLEKFSRRWGVKALYTDYHLMLAKENLDIVSVCTHPDTHKEMVIAAAQNNVKAIFCEKPIALTLKDAKEMTVTCRQHNVKLIINHRRRWGNIFRYAKQLIEDGVIGKLIHIVGNCQGAMPKRGVIPDSVFETEGPMLHDGTHLYDIFRFFAGNPVWVQAHLQWTKKEKMEDTCVNYVVFENGTSAIGMVNQRTDYLRFDLDLQGTRGRIILPDFKVLRIQEDSLSKNYNRLYVDETIERPQENSCMLEAVKEVVACIEENRESISSGEDGLAALEMIEAFYASEKLGGARVFLPLQSSVLRFRLE